MNSTAIVDSCKFGLSSSTGAFCFENISGSKSYIRGPQVLCKVGLRMRRKSF